LQEHTAADYYERRRRQELGLAEAAQSPAVRKIHDVLALRYAQLAGDDLGSGRRPSLNIVQDQAE